MTLDLAKKVLKTEADAILGDNKKNIDKPLENIQEMTKNLKQTSDDVKSNPWKLLRKP